MTDQKHILIAGGGFGGLQTALRLEKKFKNRKDIALTLIDWRDYHLFTPNLYEVATAEEELVTIEEIKRSITVPFSQILKGKNINFLKGRLDSIDPKNNRIVIGKRTVNFDYLILALGSQSDFFNIEGAEKFALVLKDLPDALRVRNQIEFAFQAHKYDIGKKNLRFVVAGGGYTGLELAGELRGLIDLLAWKYQYPTEKIEIEIIEANNKLAAGFDERLSQDAYYRLQELNIRVSLAASISRVDEHFLELATGEKIAYDVLIWTAGVKGCQLNILSPLTLDRKCRLPVNQYFQADNYHNIFALGDLACILDDKGQPVPGSAQDAVDQGAYLAYALPLMLNNQKPAKPYKPIKHGFIVNIGGKWAVMSYKGIYIKGYLAYVIDEFAHLNYYLSVVGIWAAIKFLMFQEKIYKRND
jgi:NADH:ubiquinone reductase (H+-translocating)